jgi:hypothetical protein
LVSRTGYTTLVATTPEVTSWDFRPLTKGFNGDMIRKVNHYWWGKFTGHSRILNLDVNDWKPHGPWPESNVACPVGTALRVAKLTGLRISYKLPM